jgi:hypothetical protein
MASLSRQSQDRIIPTFISGQLEFLFKKLLGFIAIRVS